METIRRNTFETNSSSCHSVTITSEKMFEEFKFGNAIYDTVTKKLYMLKDFVKILMERYNNGVEYKYWEYAEGAWEMYSQENRDTVSETCFYTDEDDIESFISWQPKEIQEWYEDNSSKFLGMVRCFDDEARKYTTYSINYYYPYVEEFEYKDTVDGNPIVAFGYYGSSN